MLLEGIVERSQKAVYVRIGDVSRKVEPSSSAHRYAEIYSQLVDGERVFIETSSPSSCVLVTDFNSGNEDYFFQRLFGKTPTPRSRTTPYQQRIINAKTNAYHGGIAGLFRDQHIKEVKARKRRRRKSTRSQH